MIFHLNENFITAENLTNPFLSHMEGYYFIFIQIDFVTRSGSHLENSKNSQVSVEKSSKLGGGKVTIILIILIYCVYQYFSYSNCFEEFLGCHSASKNPKFKKVPR